MTNGAGVGVALALVATSAYQAGLIVEKRALVRLPAVDARNPVGLLRTVITEPAWLAGFALIATGLGLQVLALAKAPVTVVQPVLASGVVILLIASRLVLAERLGRSELICVAVMAVSVVLIALSATGAAGQVGRHASGIALALVAVPTCLLAAALGLAAVRHGPGRHRAPALGVAFGLAAGLFYGVSTLAIKALSGTLLVHHLGLGLVVAIVVSPYPYMVFACSGAGLLLFQTALQRCRVSIIGPVSTIVSSVYFIVAGTWLFGERLPSDPVKLALRLVGIVSALVVVVLLSRQSPADPARPRPADKVRRVRTADDAS
jgi:drug/metabolite transporter (DMT)-like permease